MIRFKLKDDNGSGITVDSTDDAIMWMIGKTGVSVEVEGGYFDPPISVHHVAGTAAPSAHKVIKG